MQVPTTCIAYYIDANSFPPMSFSSFPLMNANPFKCALTRDLKLTFIIYRLKDLMRLNRI